MYSLPVPHQNSKPRDSQDTSMELVHTNGLDSLNMETSKCYMQAHDIILKWMKIKDQCF